jgi:hypothetical protein
VRHCPHKESSLKISYWLLAISLFPIEAGDMLKARGVNSYDIAASRSLDGLSASSSIGTAKLKAKS